VFNSLGDVLGLMSCKRSSENGQVLVGFQSTEGNLEQYSLSAISALAERAVAALVPR